MVGGRRAPICPRGCKTKTYKPQHMRRLYVKISEKEGAQRKRTFREIGWICPKCLEVIFENRSRQI